MSSGDGTNCLLILVDESSAMEALIADGTKPRAEVTATVINRLVNSLGQSESLEVALVGYRSDPDGNVDVGCRWGGDFEEHLFVPARELAEAPVRIDERIRRVPDPSGLGAISEEKIPFPVWYEPQLGTDAPAMAGFTHCSEMLRDRMNEGPVESVLVLHVTAGESTDGDPETAIDQIRQLDSVAAQPLVFHAHLGTHGAAPVKNFPSNGLFLPLGPIRTLFERSSHLTDRLVSAIAAVGPAPQPGARGMIYNGRMIDLIRFFEFGEQFTAETAPGEEDEPPDDTPGPENGPEDAAPAADDPEETDESEDGDEDGDEDGAVSESPPAGVQAVMFLIDRSVSDANLDDPQNVCVKHQERANSLINEIVERGAGQVDVAVVSYGQAQDGTADIRSTFAGPLDGREFVRDSELADGPLRIEEVETQIPNGVGGMISITRRDRVFVDLQPAAGSDVRQAMQTVLELINQWSQQADEQTGDVFVLHLTRGGGDLEAIDELDSQLREVSGADVHLYHLISTESPHPSLAYPSPGDSISDDPAVQKLFEISSPLVGRKEAAAGRSSVTEESRGIVVNGQFDLLLDGIVQGDS